MDSEAAGTGAVQTRGAEDLAATGGSGPGVRDAEGDRPGSPPEGDGEGAASAPGPSDPDDPTVAQRDRAEGQPGPGLRASEGRDPTLVTAWILVVVGYTPVRLVEALVGIGYFGPLAWPAIVAMVGVLFAVIALLRSLDLGDQRLRAYAIGALVLGMVRLFILPWF